MEDNQEVENVETEQPIEERPALSIRESLAEKLDMKDEVNPSIARTAVEPTQARVEREQSEQQSQTPTAVAPPRDMNKEEREAFLNPTSDNAHILQGYLSRRSYETRTDYERRKAEVDKLQRQTQPIFEAYQKHEQEYKQLGLSPQAVYERTIEWDMAMRENPMQAALEWLDAYGITPNDLMNGQQYGDQQYQQPEQAANYLTREEAEAIADQKMQSFMEQQQQKVVAEQTIGFVQSFMQTKPLFTATDPQTAAQLEERMAPVVQALAQQGGSPQEILETAYNYVVKGDPVFSDLANKLAAADGFKSRKTETARAKKASRSISGSVGSGSPRMSVKDIRENLRRRLNGLE